jgi:hypothetical protein
MAVQQLPQFQGADDPILQLLQNSWAQALNPVLRNPLIQGRLMEGVQLQVGDNTLDHLLGRKLQGWMITRIDAAAQVYDKQATNQRPQLTLVLNSNAAAVVSLWVF